MAKKAGGFIWTGLNKGVTGAVHKFPRRPQEYDEDDDEDEEDEENIVEVDYDPRPVASTLIRVIDEENHRLPSNDDELGPNVEVLFQDKNEEEKSILWVHVYLILLLLCSIPKSPREQTKVYMVRRASRAENVTPSASALKLPIQSVTFNKNEQNSTTHIRKSHSYFV